MNVSASPTPAAACGPVASSRDGGATTPPENAGGLDAFIALLAQVTPPVAAQPGLPALPSTVDTTETEDAPDAVDWALPFLAPPGTPPATPLDLELPDPAGTAAPTTSLFADTVAKEPPTLPTLRDAAVAAMVGADANATETDPTQALAAVAPTPSNRGEAAVTATQQLTRTVHVPVGDSRWPQQVGHEVRLLVERGVQAATLRVSPEHLGPVEVRIDIVNDKASVVFGAAQAETRAALTDALPKLREMFAEAGLALGDTGVRQDTSGGFAESPSARGGDRGDFGADDGDPAATVPGISAKVGLVDAYA